MDEAGGFVIAGRLLVRLDAASGGGSYGQGEFRSFNPLHPSSNYLGEGRFLATSNLLLITPGIAFSPAPGHQLSVEYGYARRLAQDDAAYAGGMRPYPGTQSVRGHDIGGLLRVSGVWTPTPYLTINFGVEHLSAGRVLASAGIPSGLFSFLSATVRY